MTSPENAILIALNKRRRASGRAGTCEPRILHPALAETSACYRVLGETIVFSALDDQPKLLRNQKKHIDAATAGNVLDVFDPFLIGFMLAIVTRVWQLTFGQSATVP